MTFLIKRGPSALRGRSRAHIARYDAFGRVEGAWCWRGGFDLTSNVPWGLKQCRDCVRRYNEAAKR